MIDFTPVREKLTTWPDFAGQFSRPQLIDEINQLTDTILEFISLCSDPDVTFVPDDPDAHDPFAENPEDDDLAWTLGHVIAHITASNEESAFIGAELARGVAVEFRRSRYEVDWESIITVAQARQRLEESRRMVLASLDVWPDEPHLTNYYTTPSGLMVTPVMRTLFAFNHSSSHIPQIQEIIRQSCAARERTRKQ